ncbi:uncharacterized protein LOC113866908 [Abrus precatorius]|uniref:Uncharacterized protein LOC113866908 n=1 Tax=Abrus precatorius TaxID=3816 RepID=A0A8B8LQ05_ABRPR|nr:uncharacterized protein LOC113866908 [Abrus precatorius]
MGLFPVSFGYTYILLAVDYVSKWVEAKANRTDDARVVIDFMKSHIFYRFGFPRALIGEQGSHFCNHTMAALLRKFGSMHKVSTPYHPQTNKQAEFSNQKIKQILEKTKAPYRVIFGKACHLPVEVEHKAFLTIKQCNLDVGAVGSHRKLQLQELEEICREAYENSNIYKECTKAFYDKLIGHKKFHIGKLRSRWDGPFLVINVFPYGVVELQDMGSQRSFKVNGHWLKVFHEDLGEHE